jgi:predicted RNA binding protein YcfA (HicA-like mRNA interferase family)
MPHLNPVSRRELVRKLKRLGFEGPFPGGKHQWMRRGGLRLTIPNPHEGEIDPGLIRRILLQAGITIEEWMNA